MTRPFSSRMFVRVVACAAAVWVGAPNAGAQSPEAPPPETIAVNPETIAADPPAHVSVVDGAAVLERDGQPDAAPANMPLLAGDRLKTQGGRVEILFADGSTLHLDANTTLDFQSDELVRLLDGRIRLSIPGPDREVSYRVDASAASALINQPGEYRLALLHGAREGEIELAVIRGAAELVNEDGRTPLRAGERAYARASAAPSAAYVFNSAAWDSFDRWSEARRDERLGVSAQYLPEEVRPYAPSLDRYGSWRHEPAYGYVWYPRVAVDWRPYYHGRWVTMRPYGWTWVGADAWSWPTHHYGRWGISAGVWFWIPGRHWAPAWVSWAYAPGYVSWCPLGWNNRPVLQIVNFNRYGRGYDPWRAWTSVSRRHFGRSYVNTHYVAGRTFDARTRRSFVPRSSAPDIRGYAVPRSSAPIRVAGDDAAPERRNPAAAAGPSSTVPREPVGRRAVPRREQPSAAPTSSQDIYRSSPERGIPVRPRASEPAPVYRESPYGRRAPERPQPGVTPRPEYRPYGNAVPRAPEGPRSSAPETRPYGGAPRMSHEGARPAPPAARPSGGGERRSPSADRPSGPPPAAARPSPRTNPGASAPENRSAPNQARPRSGAQSSGTAVRRSGGR
jgi:hypothetical protein